MAPTELSPQQCRTVAQIRSCQPQAEMRLHDKPGGVLIELRRGHRAQLAFIDPAGALVPDQSLRPTFLPRAA
jgi:hypothetical protein